jgi:O-methyltransferase
MNTKEAIIYCEEHNINGSFVECGVASGLQEVIICDTIIKSNYKLRHIFMFDTFSGNTMPGEKDYTIYNNRSNVHYTNTQIIDICTNHRNNHNGKNLCEESLYTVKNNIKTTNYPEEYLHFIEGDIMETLNNPINIPSEIAILRLDTDWYDSSKFELQKLFKNVVDGGVIILDDYYLWNGQKEATDEFLKENNLNYNIIQHKDYPQLGYFIKNNNMG